MIFLIFFKWQESSSSFSSVYYSDDASMYYSTGYYPAHGEEQPEKKVLARRLGHAMKRSLHDVRFPQYSDGFLPSWFLWVGWFLVACHTIACTVFTVVYGLEVNVFLPFLKSCFPFKRAT